MGSHVGRGAIGFSMAAYYTNIGRIEQQQGLVKILLSEGLLQSQKQTSNLFKTCPKPYRTSKRPIGKTNTVPNIFSRALKIYPYKIFLPGVHLLR